MSCAIKLFGSFDLILGLLSLIIQIIAAVTNGELVIEDVTFEIGSPTDNYGAGIWCGVVFLLAGIVAFKYAMSKTGTWKILLIVSAVLAIACGVVQIAVAGVTLDDVQNLGTLGQHCIENVDLCLANMTSDPNNTMICADAILGNFCDVQTAYQAILISSDTIAVLGNLVLILLAVCTCC